MIKAVSVGKCRFKKKKPLFLLELILHKTCNFRRLRGVKSEDSKYQLDLDSLQVTEQSLDVDVLNSAANVKFKLTLTALVEDTFRILIDEVAPLHPRFRLEQALDGEPELARYNRSNKFVQ